MAEAGNRLNIARKSHVPEPRPFPHIFDTIDTQPLWIAASSLRTASEESRIIGSKEAFKDESAMNLDLNSVSHSVGRDARRFDHQSPNTDHQSRPSFEQYYDEFIHEVSESISGNPEEVKQVSVVAASSGPKQTIRERRVIRMV